MKQLAHYLNRMTGDIFKLLPMKEEELDGKDNHLREYLDSLIVNAEGAIETYPDLKYNKEYLYVLNNLNYIMAHDIELVRWRTIILNSVKWMNTLEEYYKQ